ncbi:hypothetical protein BTTOUR_01505 [Bacillus thuringiensis serovar toumanoffi]|uniref:Uncharacterized protein n=1 Tax=Bacillus thuringiensis serovar toumanoffi TaxID=180862 RepID=A0ABD5HRG0_BACTU|nr:hypothetical protein [Bacillus thuringiensis serovar toumanoffi]SEG72744.1 hypothetical protein SAMN04487919_120109 [Bacillus sp. ok061]
MSLAIDTSVDNFHLSLIPDQSLSDKDFITESEEKLSKQTILLTKGLTERQVKYRPLIMDRKACIINLVVNYGLSLQGLVSLNMSHIQFVRNTLVVRGENMIRNSSTNTIKLFQNL